MVCSSPVDSLELGGSASSQDVVEAAEPATKENESSSCAGVTADASATEGCSVGEPLALLATVAGDARLAQIESRLARLESELERLVRTIRGNGTSGLVQQLLVVTERVAHQQAQLKWIVATLATVLVGALTHVLFRS